MDMNMNVNNVNVKLNVNLSGKLNVNVSEWMTEGNEWKGMNESNEKTMKEGIKERKTERKKEKKEERKNEWMNEWITGAVLTAQDCSSLKFTLNSHFLTPDEAESSRLWDWESHRKRTQACSVGGRGWGKGKCKFLLHLKILFPLN